MLRNRTQVKNATALRSIDALFVTPEL
jgi:hypothetical protein